MCQRQDRAGPRGTTDGVAGALGMLDRALAVLAETDPASLPADTQAQVLRALERAESRHTAARAGFVAAFSAQDGPEADGQGSVRAWLAWQTRITRGAAAGAIGWARRLQAHPVIGGALAEGVLSASWARQLCAWTDRLPAARRDDADEILVTAAVGGADLADLAALAEEICTRCAPADPDGNDCFDDRYLHLELTLDGVGRVGGELTPGATAALGAVLAALGKKAGPEDTRTAAQRRHDALAEACRRLIGAGMVPGRAGQPARIQVHMTLDQLRRLPGADAAEQDWARHRAGEPPGPAARPAATRADTSSQDTSSQETSSQETSGPDSGGPDTGGPGPHRRPAARPDPDSPNPDTPDPDSPDPDRADPDALEPAGPPGSGPPTAGRPTSGPSGRRGSGWLTGPEADAAACDATVVPVVTGHPDTAALSRLGQASDAARPPGLPGTTSPGCCGCTCGRCRCQARQPLPPAARRRLHAALLGLATDTLSGPGGLAARLRAGLDYPPLAAPSLPLDIGAATETIPGHLRRAALTRHPHCAFPGCPAPASTCEIHHLIPRSAGGPTALHNLVPLCRFHHLVVIHRWGWHLTLNPDGTTTAASPDGRTYHSHDPPAQAA